MYKRDLFKLSMVLIVLSLCACSTTSKLYSGPELPANQTVLISGIDNSINLVSCDGTELTSNAIIVLPGVHTLEMGWIERGVGSSMSNSFFKFKTEAGHKYLIDKDLTSQTRYSSWRAVVIDTTIGKKVPTGAARPRKAIEEHLVYLEQRNKEFPQNVAWWVDKAEALIRLQRSQEALFAVENAINLDTSNAGAWAVKSWALYELKRYDEALTAVEKSILLNPPNDKYPKFKTVVVNATAGRLASREEIEDIIDW